MFTGEDKTAASGNPNSGRPPLSSVFFGEAESIVVGFDSVFHLVSTLVPVGALECFSFIHTTVLQVPLAFSSFSR